MASTFVRRIIHLVLVVLMVLWVPCFARQHDRRIDFEGDPGGGFFGVNEENTSSGGSGEPETEVVTEIREPSRHHIYVLTCLLSRQSPVGHGFYWIVRLIDSGLQSASQASAPSIGGNR